MIPPRRETPARARRRAGRLAATLVLLAGLAPGARGQSAQGAPPADSLHPADSLKAPVYSDAQATAGAGAYETFCLGCHDDGYHTAPKFQQKWSGHTVYELFTTLRTTMPDDNPGGLATDDYLRVLAYILRQNGVTAGPDSLVADSARLSAMRLTLPARRPAAHP